MPPAEYDLSQKEYGISEKFKSFKEVGKIVFKKPLKLKKKGNPNYNE